MISTRKALPAEYLIIAQFQEKMAKETEGIRLDPVVVREGVRSVFAEPSKGCYYVAETDGRVAGSLLITYEWSDWRNCQILWIQSVYVLPEYRGMGLYSRLYSHIRQIVEDNPNYCGIRLYVDKRNKNALRIYRHCGMDDEHYRLFEWMKT